jgi:ABC-2 type transport system permease protein
MKILDIALKDLKRSFRSSFAVGMMLVAPLLVIGLIYLAFGGMSSGTQTTLPAIKVGLVNADRLPAGSPLKDSLGVSLRSMFYDESVKSWITAHDYADEASARAAVDRQEIGVAVIIPENLTENVLAAKNDSQVLIISDPTLTVGPQIVENMVAMLLDGVTSGGVAMQTLIERAQTNGAALDQAKVPALMQPYNSWYTDFQRNLFHHPDKAALVMVAPAAQGTSESPMQKMLAQMFAGQMIFFAFFTGANAMLSILREDEEGTLARMFTTPTSRTSVLAGKFLAVFLTVSVQGLVLMIVAHYAFGINWGAPAAIALALIGQVFAATGLGVLLIAFVKTSKQAGPVLGGGLTALGMLGGLFTAGTSMPESFKQLANFTPQGWVFKAWHVALDGQPLTDLSLPFVVLLLMSIVMFVIGAQMFKKRYA